MDSTPLQLRDYDSAAAQVERAEDALDGSVRALERIGYKVTR